MTSQERAARYSDLFAGGHDHAPDCAYCPICATIAVVRQTRPEVLDHLAASARELVAALGLILDEVENVVGAADRRSPAPASQDDGATVRRIDIG